MSEQNHIKLARQQDRVVIGESSGGNRGPFSQRKIAHHITKCTYEKG